MSSPENASQPTAFVTTGLQNDEKNAHLLLEIRQCNFKTAKIERGYSRERIIVKNQLDETT